MKKNNNLTNSLGQNNKHTLQELGFNQFLRSKDVEEQENRAYQQRMEENDKKRESRERIRIERISKSDKDELVYMMDKIIEKCIAREGRERIEMEAYDLGIEENLMTIVERYSLLIKLKEKRCFESVERVGNTCFVVTKPNIKKLIEYKEELENKFITVKSRKIEKNCKISKKFPEGTGWEDIRINFLNGDDINIYVKNKFLEKTNSEKMCLCHQKSKKPNKQWLFLKMLSINKGKFNLNKECFGINYNEKTRQIKSKLSKVLKNYFSIDDDPFYPTKERGGYETKFEIYPEQSLRGNGEIYGFKDIEKRYLSKNTKKQYLPGVDDV
ncbi:MAG: hypothetical protein PHZ07_01310 [Patescibacteria group bacterium]|nr:hypothetical protein [Patescibacteria group bacterium]MDD4303925.1 hypothetical protein [Patescibacteria group bacterium]MDD4695087.1 hypothetical protein [Patescibacteria group bacterium]